MYWRVIQQGNHMEYSAWLAQLKPGDHVAIYRNTGWDSYEVTKRTPSGQIVLANGQRFAQDGWEIGKQSWHKCSLTEITPEIEQKMLVNQVREMYRQVNLADLSSDALEEVLAVLEKYRKVE